VARYRSHQAAEIPGGFGLRIVMLMAALFSVIFLRAQCASGVANTFNQIAPPTSTSAPTTTPLTPE
jgi:hypothetical protein